MEKAPIRLKFTKVNGQNFMVKAVGNANCLSKSGDTGDASGNSSKTDTKESWLKFKLKRLRAEGKEYRGRKHDGSNWKKLVDRDKKSFGNVCRKITCSKKKTCHRLHEGNALSIFEGFWKSGDREVQNTFIRSMVCIQDKNRMTVGDESRRNLTLRYHFKQDGHLIEVCKSNFLNVLAISEKRVRYTCFSKTGPDIQAKESCVGTLRIR